MKLSHKLILVALCPFIGIIILLGTLSAERETAAYRGQVADDLRITGESLRSAIRDVWLREGETRALGVLKHADEQLQATRISWVALGTDRSPPSREFSPADLALLEGGRNVALVDGGSIGGTRAFVYVPIEVNGSVPGAIELSESMARESDVVVRIIRDRALTTLAVILATIFFGHFVGQRIVGRPVAALVAQARRVAHGDLSQRLTFAGSDELGELAAETNAMCDQLEVARDRISMESQARIDALSQLRHAERLVTVGRMAAGVAHELGTPLNVVSGRARMIMRGTDSDDVVEHATIIDSQTRRMTTIIRQLLAFARRGNPNRTSLEIPRIVHRTVQMLQPFAKKSSVRIHVECANQDIKVDADGGQLEQVLTNLVMNGILAMPHGGELRISTKDIHASPPAEHGGPSGRYICLEVCDAGVGIAEADLGRIFEPFFTTRDVGEGTGLGLSVTHGIVHDHGGWMEVKSTLGMGSRFSVFLPHSAAA